MTADAAATPKKTPKKTPRKTGGAAKKAASHPTYAQMVNQAIKHLKERKGSSKAAILKYILQNYKVGDNIKSINAHLRSALKRGVTAGKLKQVKGSGASGSFRLPDAPAKTGATKRVAKKTTAKKAAKPAAKATKAKKPKSPKKKSPKKPKATPKKAKAAPKKAKKTPTKKSPKKAKAKKTPAKK